MGSRSWNWALVWASVALFTIRPAESQSQVELSSEHPELTGDGQKVYTAPTSSSTRHVTFIPPITVFPTMSPVNLAHNGRVCSTWGDFHYKTFDGDMFHFPGLCNYVFSSHCGATYEDFNIQLRRGLEGSRPVVTHVVLRAQGLVIELANGSVLVDGQRVQLPYSRAGLLMEKTSGYVKVSIRLVLTFLWNEDSALLELDSKYTNQTCGLCGDFNGLPAVNEFYAHNTRLTPVQFGNLQKLDGPTEQCQDTLPSAVSNCTDREDICRRILLGPAFAKCIALVDVNMYLDACVQDLCRCPTCPCATFAEYSRQCAHAGGHPQNWRSPDLCSTVLDDIRHLGCLPLEQCHCTHGGHTYAPGESFNTSCSSCTCSGGLWQCQELPCPGTCSVQGGSHVFTYDEKLYNVHGDCSYVLSKKCADSGFTVLVDLRKCGLTDTENCLKVVTLNLNSGDMVIRIQANGAVFLNSIFTQLPMSAANVTIFSPSSFFIVVQTGMGLQLQVQLVPFMQVFVRLDPSYHGQMCGLCGNFNQNQADDFTALSGVVEGTGAAFSNTWKTQASCPNSKNTFEDPCSYSVETENYAQKWCSMLTESSGVFSACHATISPVPFYSVRPRSSGPGWNCLFDTCNCENSEDCMCAALSSYVHACAAKGVLLSGWRDNVCFKYMNNCPQTKNYSYAVSTCEPTCRSLSEADVTCGVSFVPVDGCTCPEGTFLNDKGHCVRDEECPCFFHGTVVAPREFIMDNGVVCTCRNRRWECTDQPCMGACVAYGDGHFVTFDGERYIFEGSCEYTLAQDYCRGNTSTDGTFRIVTENVPCGTTGTTCSKAIKIFVERYMLILHEGNFKVVERGPGGDLPYKIRYMGIFLVIEIRSGIVVSWDKKTSVFVRLQQHYKGRVCGLCGNFDDNAINDFTTRSQSVVGDVLEFGNSWKFSPSCPDAPVPKDPCTANPYRKSWAQKKCSIINSETFAACHSQVDSTKYYEACVHDVCACDTGGDCECFCTAVAAYAQACRDVGVCLSWRTPDICPLFCDYYNPHGECEWHYQPCGDPCLKTCRNPTGHCLVDLSGLEGCYPQCPPSQPFFNEDQMKCVAQCGCYDDDGNYHDIGTQVPTAENCQNCLCTPDGLKCVHNLTACICTYEGRTYHYNDVVYNTTDGLGACLVAICKENGTIIRTTEECPAVSSTTPFTFTTTLAPHTTTGSAPTISSVSTVCVREVCRWSIWYDESHPEPGMTGGDFETFENLRQKGYQVCQSPAAIECRAEKFPSMDLQKLGQKVNCDPSWGLKCLNSEQSPPLCYNYELRVLCCDYVPCSSTQTSGASTTHSQPEISRESSWPTHSTQTASSVSKSTPSWTTEGKETSLDTIHSTRQTVTFTSNRRTTSNQIGSTNSASNLVTTSPTSVFTSQTGSTSRASMITQIIRSPVTSSTCQPQCQWTGWLDTDYPTSDSKGEDIETYERIRATGTDICEQPQGIQCKAQNYPDLSLDMLGQEVTCDVNFGLVCRNRDQKGKSEMCHNYMIRVLCCSMSHCQGPTTTAGSTPTPRTATTATQTLSSKPYPNTSPVETWSPSGSTTSTQGTEMPTSGILTASVSSPPSTSLTATSKTTQHPRSPESSGTPSVVTTRSTSQGNSLPPRSPHATNIFSATTSRTSLARGTTFSTSLTTPGPSYSPPGSTIMGSATAASMSSAITHSKTTPEHTGSPSAGTTEALRTLTTSTSAASMVTTPVTSTTCQPQCQWTGWLDTDYPTSDSEGEDIETFERIRATGTDICEQPQGIQCEAQNYPDLSLDMLGQEVTCDVNFGLVCRNRDQKGKSEMCHNYMIRVLCCSVSHCQGPTTTAGSPPTPRTATTATQTLSSKPYPNTSPIETWSPSGSTDSIQGTEMPTSGILTASVSSPPSTSLTATSKTTQHPRSPESSGTPSVVTTRSTSQGNSLPPRSPHATNIFSATTSRTSLARGTTFSTSLTTPGPSYSPPGSTTMSSATAASMSSAITHFKTTPELTGSPSAGTTEALGTLTTSTSAASMVTTPVTSTTCQPQCQWTGWLDTDYPTSDIEGEDIETYERIRATGTDICEQPQGIQCEAQNYPDLSLDMLGQEVTCDVNFGLVCRNRDQKGKSEMCHNYMIRVLCCSVSHCQGPTTTAGSPPTPQTATTASSRSITHTSWPVSSISTSTSTTESISSPGKTTVLTMASSTVTTTPKETRPSSWLSTGLSPALTTTRTTSTGCKFQCTWTDWLDSDKPQPGQFGGDIETYYNIRNKTGIQVCNKPVDIECEAILFPNMSFQQLGQEVVCNVDFGLICRNSKQANNQTCFNYHIRVLCCEEAMSCLSTTGSLSTTFSQVTESPHTPGPLSSTSTPAPGFPSTVSMSTNKRPLEEPTPSTLLTTLRRTSFPKTDRVVSIGTAETTESLSVSSLSPSSASLTTFLQTSKEQHSGKPNTTSWTASSSASSTAKLTTSTGTSTGFPRSITTLQSSLPPSTPTTPTRSTKPKSTLMTTKNPQELITSNTSNSHSRLITNTLITTASSPAAMSTEQFRESISSASLTTPGPSYSPPGSTTMGSATAASMSSAITHSKTTPELTGSPSAGTTEALRKLTTSISAASTITHTVTMPVTSTTCQPQCQWTGWLDTDYPTSDSEGEDIETYERIRATGTDICEQPQGIQCKAQNYPDLSLDMLGQEVTCDVNFGLVCHNRDQKGKSEMCHNYMIRVLCCSVSHCQGPTTTAGSPSTPRTATTATQTLTSKPYPNTSPVETWSPSGSTTSTQGTEMPTSGILTANVSSPPRTSLTATSKTTQHPRSPESSGTPSVVTTRSTSQGNSLPPRSPHATNTFSATTSRTSLARGTTFSTSLTTPGQSYSPPGSTTMSSATAASMSSAITHSKTTPELTGSPSAGTTEALGTLTTSTSAASTVTHTVTMPVTSTTCQPQCQWTGWLDTDYPTSDIEGEDIETYERIRATGTDICEQPQGILCEAQNYPDLSLDMLGQEVTCDVNFGLVCHNRDQKGDFPMCLNYMIRVLCCSVSHCQGPTTTAGSPPTPRTATTATQTLSSKSQANTSLTVTTTYSASTTVATSLSKTPPGSSYTPTIVTSSTRSTPHVSSVTESSSPGTLSSIHTTLTIMPKTLKPSTHALTTKHTSSSGIWTKILTGTAGTVFSKLPPTSLTTVIEELSTSPPRMQTLPVTMTTATTSQGTTHCQPKCTWTEWFDVDSPTSGVVRGDMETYENIRASGKKMCQAPEKIECRAENYPAVSIDKVGQVVSCSLETGLVCKNEDQTDDFKMCFNYNIRVLCCDDYSQCPSTTAVPPTSTTNKPKASNEVPTMVTSSSTRQRHSTKATTSSKTSDSLMTNVIHTEFIPSTHSVSSPVTSTTCQPQCQWTGWLDTDYPTSDSEGEDIETYERIRATGTDICEQPQGIQCKAQNYPDLSLDMLGQEVTCDVNFGLVCRNRDQKGKSEMCHNYMIRVLCCSVSHCQGPTTTAGSTPTPRTATTATQTLTSKSYPNTSPVETWSPSGSTTSTQGTEMPTSGILTASVSSPPSTSLSATSKTTQHPRSPESSGTPSVVTIRSTSQGNSLPPRSPHATNIFSATTSRTSLARGTTFSTSLTTPEPSYSPPGSTTMGSATAASMSSAITHSKTTPELTGSPSAGTTEALGTLTTSTSAASMVTHTVTTPVTSTTCQPQCQWTGWLDTDYPTSDIEGEDIETYERIRATGTDICEQPQGIQCEAQNYPDMSLDRLGQEVTCDVNFGLVCHNRDQKGDFPMCLNYMIRVLCCSVSHCQGPTTTAGSPSTPRTATTATETLTSKSYPNTSPIETWSPSGSTDSIQGTEMPTSGFLTASVSSPPRTSLTATSKTTQHPRSPESSGTPSVVTIRSTSQGNSLPPRSPHATNTFSATTSRTSLARGTTFSTSLTTPGQSYSPPGSTTMSSATAASMSSAITHSKTTPELTGSPSAGTTEALGTLTTSTSAASTITHTVTMPVTSTTCQPQCQWTGWLDTDYPTSDIEGEDIETYERIRATGTDICEQPQGIQCEAQNYPDMSLDMLGQEVTCDVNFGLVCRNRDQKGDFPMCLNYMIRVLCCSVSHCQGPTTTAGSPPIPRIATTGRLSTTSINTSWVSPSTLSHTSATSTPTSTSKENQSSSLLSTRTTIISTPLSSSTGCKPQCTWSDWLDHSSPIPGSSGGEFETYANIRAAGIAVCEKPLDLECDVVDPPHVPQQESRQVINCSLNFGLVCRNLDQPGPFSVCLNYRIRVLCCDGYSHCPSTPSSTRTSAPPLSTHTSLVPFTTTVASSTESTFQTKHPFSSPVPSTQSSTWTTLTDSGCAPRCTWTDWFDADYPNPGPRGGDFEVYAVLREVGFVFCEQPKDIQCRSEKEPDRPLETLEQVVQCDVRFGLICKNINQSGPLQYCDNYQLRLLCCDNTTHCTTPAMATPSTVPSTPTLLSTHTSPTSNTMTSSPVATSSIVPHSSSLVPTPILTTATSPGATGPTAAPSSTAETTHTPELSPSSQVTLSMSTVSPLGLSTLRSTGFSSQSVSPSPCFCRAFGQLFLPGDVIYNKTDGAGCQFYATCNQNCELDRFQGACPSSSPPVPSTHVPLSTLLPGCDNAIPPRQVNESWTLENCTVARCQGNNQIILEEPEPVDNVTCVNKHSPIKVWDQEPCHFHYECECEQRAGAGQSSKMGQD
ncbi:MUC5B [Lemmus lemmus]